MEFNEKWSKHDNDIMRNMIKEGKTTNDIIDYFGIEKLRNHPNKFKYGGVLPYEQYINEVIIHPERVFYSINQRPSLLNKDKYDYLLSFYTKGISYVIILFYSIIEGIESHIISFTTKEQFDEYSDYIDNINGEQTTDDTLKLIDIFEKTTNYNDIYKLMKNISYVLFNFLEKNEEEITLSILEGNDKRRINLYRNIIEDSFVNLKEYEIITNDKKLFYYKKEY